MVAQILVKNHSKTVSDAELQKALPALQKQVTHHVAPAWGTDAKLAFVKVTANVPVGLWLIVVVDDADQADALGYHETTDNGDPLGYVFARTAKDAGDTWTEVFSHELIEMLGDSAINLAVLDPSQNRLWARELCDPVEANTYSVDGVTVSNFVLPQYFDEETYAVRWDYLGVLSAPLSIAPGGYASYLDFDSPDGWQQIEAARLPGRMPGKEGRPHGLSRHRRRNAIQQRKTKLAPKNPPWAPVPRPEPHVPGAATSGAATASTVANIIPPPPGATNPGPHNPGSNG